MTTVHATCRVCPNDVTLTSVLDLGSLHISAFPLPAASVSQEKRLAAQHADPVPLHLLRCPQCTLVQLSHTIAPSRLYTNYWYRSGVNETMVAELQDVVRRACSHQPRQLSATDAVLDIGANDGTLLGQYKAYLSTGGRTPMRIAYEPAHTFETELGEHTDLLRATCFPEHTTAELLAYVPQRFQIITSIAMFYDLDDPNAFVHAIKELLAEKGVWVVQFQDLAGMLESGAFDSICHEHLEYYTLHSLMNVLRHNQLEVKDVERRAINGGSLRCYVGHRAYSPPWMHTGRVLEQLAREGKELMDEGPSLNAFGAFRERIAETRNQLRAVLNAVEGPVDGYGASTKGNTLLQLYTLGGPHPGEPGNETQKIRQIAERSPAKVGRVTIGTSIPIVSEETWRADPAAVTLCNIWQFRDAVLRRERGYLEAGGKFVFPLPRVEVVGG